MVLNKISKQQWTLLACLCVCLTVCGCSAADKEDFSVLQDIMEQEEPYLSQDIMEEQLNAWLEAYIYYEGGIAYEAPLLSYEDEVVDYIVFHTKQWDLVEPYKSCSLEILLQPRSDELFTSWLSFTIYNDCMYSIDYAGRNLDGKNNFSNLEDAQKGLSEHFGQFADMEKTTIWYAGTLSAGKGGEPQCDAVYW